MKYRIRIDVSEKGTIFGGTEARCIIDSKLSHRDLMEKIMDLIDGVKDAKNEMGENNG